MASPATIRSRVTDSMACRMSSSVAPSLLVVSSASGRRIGLITTIGVVGWPLRITSRKPRKPSSSMPVLCGVRVQQLDP